MKLSYNLKKIRKENNLSQEQLAEKLGVSRQAVSKWESEQSYPEMDKVLLICKLFNYNMDELMNENVKEVDEEKQSKININKYIEDFFAFITKTVDMLSHMTWKQKLKCLVEQIIVGAIIATIFAIMGSIVYNALSLEKIMLQVGVGKTILYIIEAIGTLYYIFALIVGIAVLLHIFKIRYLDYYEVIKQENHKQDMDDKNNTIVTNEKAEESTNSIKIERKKEKIIIRDPEHSESKFLNGIMKIILLGIKCIVAFFAMGFIFTFISLVAILILSFLFIKTGLAFVGAFMGILSGICINFVILEIIYNFIVNKKSKKNRIAIIFIIALVLAGLGIGTFCVGMTKFNYIDKLEDAEETIFEMEMSDNLSIGYWNNVEYVETNSDSIKIIVRHSKYSKAYAVKENENIEIHYIQKNENVMQEIRNVIKDINNRTIRNYIPTVYVYTSKDNIQNLIMNRKKVEEAQEKEIDDLKESIRTKEQEIESLEQEIQELKMIE